MRITLINPFRFFGLNRFLYRRFQVPAATMPYLASLVSSDFELEIIDESRQKIDFGRPTDLVAISTLTVLANRVYAIAKQYRRRGVKVILGGPHVSALPDEAMKYCDSVAVGNAEHIFPQMLKDFKAGSLKPAYYNRIPSALPHRLPFVPATPQVTSILASRGCEMNCEFCTMQNIFGNFYLQRQLEGVIEEIKQAATPYLFFCDDNFWGATRRSQDYYRSLLKEVTAKSVKWVAQCRLDVINDIQTLDMFRESGCVGLLIGFESINPRNQSSNRKQRIDREYYRKIIDKIHAHGIGIIGSFIFGFDQDTPETVRETTQFCIESKIGLALFTVLTPFPGTALYKKLFREDRIISRNWDDYTMHKCVFQPRNFTPNELEKDVIRATKDFYSIGSIFSRFQRSMNYGYLDYLLPNALRNIALKFGVDRNHSRFRVG